jgi:hypothetical protein
MITADDPSALTADQVEQRATEPRPGVLRGHTADHATSHKSGGKAGRTQQQPSCASYDRPLERLAADELALVIGIDVVPGECAPKDDAVTPVMLDERYFRPPPRARRVARRSGVRQLRAVRAFEHH